MKYILIILITILISSSASAQVNTDSVQQKIGSINQKLPNLPDTLLPTFHKVDSIRSSFNKAASVLKNEFQQSVSKIDSTIGKLNHTIDSLQNLNLSTRKYTKKLNKLNQLRKKTEANFTSKANALKAKTTDKLKVLDLPPQYNEPLQEITQKVDGFNLNSDFVKIPEVNVPGYSLPKIDGIGDLSSKAGDIGNLGSLPSGLPKIETPVGDIGNVGEQVKGYQGDIKSISEGNLNDVEQLPQTLDAQAAEMDGVQELQKQSGVIDEYKTKLEAVKDPESAKKQAVEIARKAAVDHFAGKQEQLKGAMQKISKYKQKYSSVTSIKDLPKRAPNAMNGKPFIERLVPGFYFQYQQKNYNLFDLNPYIGYRISGRFTAGAGWNHRYAYEKRTHLWNRRARIFGPRAYVDFKLGKGFMAHLESEVMNAFVPSVLTGNTDIGEREWVWGMMTGMKKEYRIYKNLKGTMLLQYNIFNPKYKAPYVDRLNSRIGFEYMLKKNPKKADK